MTRIHHATKARAERLGIALSLRDDTVVARDEQSGRELTGENAVELLTQLVALRAETAPLRLHCYWHGVKCATRLCAEAKDGQILVAQRIAVAVEGTTVLEEIGALALKGFTRPVPAFNVLVPGGGANLV
jgi:hypothetical protein